MYARCWHEPDGTVIALVVYDDDDVLVAAHIIPNREGELEVEGFILKPNINYPKTIEQFTEEMRQGADRCGLKQIETYLFDTVGFETTDYLE